MTNNQKGKRNKKEQIKRQIASTDSEIDDKVYKLCGLTDKEIEIVENAI